MSIAIYTLTSELHDEKAVSAVTKEFLDSLNLGEASEEEVGSGFDFKGGDYADYGSHALDLIYVRTGGTEGIFKRLLPDLLAKSARPFYLLTSGKSNSKMAAESRMSIIMA